MKEAYACLVYSIVFFVLGRNLKRQSRTRHAHHTHTRIPLLARTTCSPKTLNSQTHSGAHTENEKWEFQIQITSSTCTCSSKSLLSAPHKYGYYRQYTSITRSNTDCAPKKYTHTHNLNICTMPVANDWFKCVVSPVSCVHYCAALLLPVCGDIVTVTCAEQGRACFTQLRVTLEGDCTAGNAECTESESMRWHPIRCWGYICTTRQMRWNCLHCVHCCDSPGKLPVVHIVHMCQLCLELGCWRNGLRANVHAYVHNHSAGSLRSAVRVVFTHTTIVNWNYCITQHDTSAKRPTKRSV